MYILIHIYYTLQTQCVKVYTVIPCSQIANSYAIHMLFLVQTVIWPNNFFLKNGFLVEDDLTVK